MKSSSNRSFKRTSSAKRQQKSFTDLSLEHSKSKVGSFISTRTNEERNTSASGPGKRKVVKIDLRKKLPEMIEQTPKIDVYKDRHNLLEESPKVSTKSCGLVKAYAAMT